MQPAQDYYRSPLPTVTEISSVPFAQVVSSTGKQETLLLDIYLPTKESHQLRPVIFWFHGGGFRPGNDRRQIYVQIFSRAFAERGCVCVAPDYRVRDDRVKDTPGTVTDAVADGRAAVEWFLTRADQYQVDPSQVILAGGSAGGMLVANLVHHPVLPLDGNTTSIRGVVSLWGPPLPETRLFTALNPACPPVFLVHGTADQLVPYQHSHDLHQELLSQGTQSTLMTIPDAPHTPVSESNAIINNLDVFFREVCGITYEHRIP